MSELQINNLLLTGLPGCGKTTVVRRVIERLGGRRLAGFYTQEIRREGRRLGFEAVALGGRRAVLAHVELRTKKRVGRYGVDVAAFDAVVQAELRKSPDEVALFVLDEIGKMECFSRLFVEAATVLLDGRVPVLATIALKGGGFIREVKARPDVELLTVTAANRQDLPHRLVERLGGA
jgi:nucleoside-triphosphatase